MTPRERRTGIGLGLVALIFLSLAGGTLAQDGRPLGQVIRQQGVVVAVRGKEANVLTIGAPVFSSDRIRTEQNARTMIAFADGAHLTIGPGSEVQIADYVLAANGSRS